MKRSVRGVGGGCGRIRGSVWLRQLLLRAQGQENYGRGLRPLIARM